MTKRKVEIEKGKVVVAAVQCQVKKEEEETVNTCALCPLASGLAAPVDHIFLSPRILPLALSTPV